MTKQQTIALLLLTVIFFLVGQFEYENIYRVTLYTIKALSNVSLSFYGKFPYWFGDTTFSLIISSIPLTVFLTSKLLSKSRNRLPISIFIYTVYFICTYIFVCIATGLSFHIFNDFYHGEKLSLNLREVKINEVFLTTIGLTTILTSLSFLFIKLIKWIKVKVSKK